MATSTPPLHQKSLLPGEDKPRLRGRVTRVLFENPDNGFAIARFASTTDGAEFVAAGTLFDLRDGEELELTGEFEINRHGRRFNVESYQPVLPSTPKGIARYLASGIIEGVGKVTAERIVAALGADTLRILDEEPDRLFDVSGIGPKRGSAIASAWKARRAWREFVVFLQSVGLSATLAPKLIRQYGEDAPRIIRRNPYEPALDVSGIGFLTADRIARALGIAEDSVERAAAAIVHVLKEAVEEGHTALPRDEVVRRCRDGLRVPEAVLEPALESLVASGRVTVESAAPEALIYPTALERCERFIAHALAAAMTAKSRLRDFDGEKAVDWYEKRAGVKLTERQAEAVVRAVREPILVITGGPGTGKTTIVRAVVEIIEALKGSVLLAAPTGRAAKQLGESCGREAKTLHRLLELQPGGRRTSQALVDADVLIVDESGMIDVNMAAQLLQARAPHTHIVFVGDVDQLPSVGPGTFLSDLIGSGRLGVVRLNEIFRQAETSRIVTNAHRILSGRLPETGDEGSDSDFHFIVRDNPAGAQNTIVELVARRLPRAYDLDPMRDIQVLSPMHKGAVGVRALNEHLQRALNPDGASIERGGWAFRMGDRVMQTANDYDRGVFNGDLGRVCAVDDAGRFIRVNFDGREVAVEGMQFDDLAPAYAMSIHKSQGSEYPAVVVALSTQHFVMLQRNLLYTAVTRARRLVVLVGSRNALSTAIKNDAVRRRFGRLRERVEEAVDRKRTGEGA